MCGRFLFDADFDEVYNKLMIFERSIVIDKRDFRPTDQVPVVIHQESGNVAKKMKWGLKGFPENKPLINARSETILQKQRYSKIADNRCVIPATSFYEPETIGHKKVMHTFGSGKILYLAGLFESDFENDKVTIITMDAFGDVQKYHPRMPVAISEDHIATWLEGEREQAYRALLSQKPEYKRLDPEIQMTFF